MNEWINNELNERTVYKQAFQGWLQPWWVFLCKDTIHLQLLFIWTFLENPVDIYIVI